MKIVNICFMYQEGLSYQDNLLPKYQARLGHDVVIVTSFARDDGALEYVNPDGLKVYVCDRNSVGRIARKLGAFRGVYEILCKEKPDLIFFHGVQSLAAYDVKKYVMQNPSVRLRIDNHADLTNSAMNFISRNILHKILWRCVAKSIDPYVEKWFGVLPCRIDFIVDLYKIPRNKCELLVMGGDDDYVAKYSDPELVARDRIEHGVASSDIVICTGGKIDYYKRQTLLLMKAVKRLDKHNVKLFVFGSVDDNIKEEFFSLIDNKTVFYLGWLSYEPVHAAIAMSDIMVFPGRHSVLWEQSAALGKPVIMKDLPGSHHIDQGGNALYLKEDSEDEMHSMLSELLADDASKLRDMQDRAKETEQIFAYSRIAEQSIK